MAYSDITINVDTANEWIPPVRLHAGDDSGRQLRFIVTNGGSPIPSKGPINYSARLLWNAAPDDPASAGGMLDLTIGYTTELGDETLMFSGYVPRALLNTNATSAILCFELTSSAAALGKDAPNNLVCSRNFTAFIEPSVLKASAPDIADPLKALHDAAQTAQDAAAKAGQAVERANQVIDTAQITSGTTTTLKPNQPAASELAGSGLTRTLNLGLPRGASIASITATTAEGSTPTVATDKNADGDLTVSLGIPRGEKGDPGSPGAPGPKGDPGDASTIASSTVAGVVKVGSGLAITKDGTLSASAQPVPPATAEQMGIVKPGKGLSVDAGTLNVNAGSGLEFDSDGALGIKTGAGLSFGTVGNGDWLQVNPATADAIGGVKVGAGLSVDSTGVLSTSNTSATVALASDGEQNVFARLVAPGPTAQWFVLDFFGTLAFETAAAKILLTFPDAISFSGSGMGVAFQFVSRDVQLGRITVLAKGHTVSLTDLTAGMNWSKIISFPPLLARNSAANGVASTVADAADDPVKLAPLSCTIDWSKL